MQVNINETSNGMPWTARKIELATDVAYENLKKYVYVCGMNKEISFLN